MGEDGICAPPAALEADHTEEAQKQEEQAYSKVWNGYYTQREIDYLDEYYAQLEEGFVLDNQNIRDYARKAAKASLDADIKYNRMRQGKASVAEWEKAQAIFDNLSKSANFAACKRKPGDMAGAGFIGRDRGEDRNERRAGYAACDLSAGRCRQDHRGFQTHHCGGRA